MKTILLFLFISLAAGVTLKQKASKIYVGSALAPEHFSDAEYKTVASQQFNCLTPENQMKWESMEYTKGQKNYGPADQLVQFAEQHGMKVRGHTLVWYMALPKWVQDLQHNKAELKKAMEQHIREEMTHFKGKIYAWDVVNEVFSDQNDGKLRDNSIWNNNFGESYIVDAFKIAHEVDPHAKLYINEYNVEGKNPKSDGLYNLVKKLKSQGVPIQGVGLQCHFIVGQIPHDFEANLKRFADLGVDVAITELDIRMQLPSNAQKLQEQAKDYARIFKACEDTHGCVGVTVWGYTDKYSWVPSAFKGFGDANLFDSHFKPKPAVTAVENVLK